ncbi:unnamed protein product [Citrullus colocynthis]|uniref:Uncharacterized protein n=1 Tax=Citrullus colocynthis TaxID=252529 RepID=A0ABP0Y673_9ROSI
MKILNLNLSGPVSGPRYTGPSAESWRLPLNGERVSCTRETAFSASNAYQNGSVSFRKGQRSVANPARPATNLLAYSAIAT